jgi:hypothetical protein
MTNNNVEINVQIAKKYTAYNKNQYTMSHQQARDPS